jgi:mycothiol system anti-sigma-R factor
MNCKETIERLQTFVDRELSDAEVVEVRMHLTACPPCQDHFKFEERLKILVRQRACPEKAPSTLRDRICQKLREAESRAPGPLSG